MFDKHTIKQPPPEIVEAARQLHDMDINAMNVDGSGLLERPMDVSRRILKLGGSVIEFTEQRPEYVPQRGEIWDEADEVKTQLRFNRRGELTRITKSYEIPDSLPIKEQINEKFVGMLDRNIETHPGEKAEKNRLLELSTKELVDRAIRAKTKSK